MMNFVEILYLLEIWYDQCRLYKVW